MLFVLTSFAFGDTSPRSEKEYLDRYAVTDLVIFDGCDIWALMKLNAVVPDSPGPSPKGYPVDSTRFVDELTRKAEVPKSRIKSSNLAIQLGVMEISASKSVHQRVKRYLKSLRK